MAVSQRDCVGRLYPGQIRRLPEMTSRDNRLSPDVMSEFAKSAEWHRFEDLVRSVGGAWAVDPQKTAAAGPEASRVIPQASAVCSRAEAPVGALTAGNDLSRAHHDLGEKRSAVVMPILKAKRWSRSMLVTRAGVSKNSVYCYLAGKRRLSHQNRKALAEELGLTPSDLPE